MLSLLYQKMRAPSMPIAKVDGFGAKLVGPPGRRGT